MKARCNNPKSTNYDNYGGRGIKVCDRWMASFENFREDMRDCPPGLTIDRIDVDGNYEPKNCKWATRSEQMRNTRFTKLNEEVVKQLRDGKISVLQAMVATGAALTTIMHAKNGESWKDLS